MQSSQEDENVKMNIANHIAMNEGYEPTPYIDPNFQQANIGYGHTFYFFPQSVIAASRKYSNDDQRKAYLMSQIPAEYKKWRWDKPKALGVLWGDFSTHRNIADKWLKDNGISNAPGRLVDQLGMMFYGSTGGNFRKSSGAKIGLQEAKAGNFDTLSAVASRWGRTADGRPLKALAQRRDAERRFFHGETLPEERKGYKPVTTGQVSFNSRQEPLPLKPLSSSTQGVPDDPNEYLEDLGGFREAVLGERGRRKADELTWQIFGGGGPMPDNFDSLSWAQDFVGNMDSLKPPPFEPVKSPANMDAIDKALEKYRATQGDREATL